MEASVEFNLPARIRKKGDWFVSSCPALDVFSQGRTFDEAERNLREALTGFILSCYERGTLQSVLRDAGFVAKPSRKTESAKAGESVKVRLPLSVARRASAAA